MTLTHAQLLAAVRAAGRDRETFTCADVRQQLGLSTADRKQMSRFYSRFRALQQDGASELEKLGNNCYRLRMPAGEPAIALAQAEPSASEVVALAQAEPSASEVVALAEAEPSVSEVVALAEPLPCALEALPRAHEVAESAPAVESSGAEEPSPLLAPARPAPAAKPRAQWLSRMAAFFSRRGSKSEVGPSVAVGA